MTPADPVRRRAVLLGAAAGAWPLAAPAQAWPSRSLAPATLAQASADAAMAVGSSAAEFGAFIAGEQQRWKPGTLRAKVKPD